MKYLQTNASKYVHGAKPTNNPTMAARFAMGPGATRTLRAYERRVVKKRRFRGNPNLASIASLVPIPGAAIVAKALGALGIKTGSPRYDGGPLISTVQGFLTAARGGDLTAVRKLHELATSPGEKHRTQWAKVWATELPAQALPRAVQLEVVRLDPSRSVSVAVAPAAAGAGAASLLTPGLVTGVVRALKPTRARRQRYPTYSDRYGRQRYSTKPPGTELRLPAGATLTAGTPYNFFTGAVGRGGAAATAGQLALAGAAGVAAYLVTQRVLQHLGGRAQAKEEAGVAAALAFRQARADFKQQQGRAPNRAELAEMKQAYQQQLVELGYDPVTFTRQRSRVAEFLETYNPLGG